MYYLQAFEMCAPPHQRAHQLGPYGAGEPASYLGPGDGSRCEGGGRGVRPVRGLQLYL